MSGEANLTEDDKSIKGILRRNFPPRKNKTMANSIKNLVKISFAIIFLQCFSAGCANAQIIPNQDRPKVEASSNIDLSTDEAVREELAKISGGIKLDNLCIERLKESAKIIVIGNHANDRDCEIDGAFVNSRYFEKTNAAFSKMALDALGWEAANRERREQLAKLWAEKGLSAFFTVLYTKDKDFGSGDFQPPTVVSSENGETVATLWVSFMTRKKEFKHLEYRFAKDGNLLEGSTFANAQHISNQDRPKPIPVHKRCIKKRLTESGEIEVYGHFRTEYGCYFGGVFVNSQHLKKDDAMLSKIVLAALGWEKANKTKREKLAKLWVEKGLMAYSRVLYIKDEDLNDDDFQPPQVVSTKNGEIKVTLWIIKPSGKMRMAKSFKRLEFIFASDGNLTGNSTI